jgi:uncharacterized protein
MFTLRVAKSQPEYVTYRERYKVDLPLQMAECEANYARLHKLLTQHFDKQIEDQQGDEYRFMMHRGEQQWLNQLRIVERSPYTTTLQLSQVPVANSSPWLHMPRLTVRMYHDAKLAEVLAWEGHRRLRPRYEYPNQAMYHNDEKLQVNQFLGEWLKISLERGLHIAQISLSDLR